MTKIKKIVYNTTHLCSTTKATTVGIDDSYLFWTLFVAILFNNKNLMLKMVIEILNPKHDGANLNKYLERSDVFTR